MVGEFVVSEMDSARVGVEEVVALEEECARARRERLLVWTLAIGDSRY